MGNMLSLRFESGPHRFTIGLQQFLVGSLERNNSLNHYKYFFSYQEHHS